MEDEKLTTGEIAKAMRICEQGDVNCDECPMWKKKCGDLIILAADRLENQERELSGITGELKAITDRAEQTEKDLYDAIFRTNHSCFYCTREKCNGCTNSSESPQSRIRRAESEVGRCGRARCRARKG